MILHWGRKKNQASGADRKKLRGTDLVFLLKILLKCLVTKNAFRNKLNQERIQDFCKEEARKNFISERITL